MGIPRGGHARIVHRESVEAARFALSFIADKRAVVIFEDEARDAFAPYQLIVK